MRGVEGEAPHEPGGLGGGVPLIQFFCSDFDENVFAHVSDDIKQKKNILSKKEFKK